MVEHSPKILASEERATTTKMAHSTAHPHELILVVTV